MLITLNYKIHTAISCGIFFFYINLNYLHWVVKTGYQFFLSISTPLSSIQLNHFIRTAVFPLTRLYHLLSNFFLTLLFQFPYLPSGSEYFSACTIDYEQEAHSCTGSSPLWPWNVTRWPRKKKKKIQATNEVLSEINNAMCTVLKDFSIGGVFSLLAPQKSSQVGSWVGWFAVARPPLLD